ncbi:unnamed protein product [Protopolystoma xenopodis]|uniref:Uncharacterized protein n=1 Tax=Protopolystoma xenopodis TaxID=117903 RepID=A0A3S5AEY7_9PLAT|nr:unnamed protein product [Protopolystoma xenopodis]
MPLPPLHPLLLSYSHTLTQTYTLPPYHPPPSTHRGSARPLDPFSRLPTIAHFHLRLLALFRRGNRAHPVRVCDKRCGHFPGGKGANTDDMLSGLSAHSLSHPGPVAAPAVAMSACHNFLFGSLLHTPSPTPHDPLATFPLSLLIAILLELAFFFPSSADFASNWTNF